MIVLDPEKYFKLHRKSRKLFEIVGNFLKFFFGNLKPFVFDIFDIRDPMIRIMDNKKAININFRALVKGILIWAARVFLIPRSRSIRQYTPQ